MTLALRVLLIFGCFQNISPSRIHGKRYIISLEMNDKVSTDMGKPFPSGNQSLLYSVLLIVALLAAVSQCRILRPHATAIQLYIRPFHQI